MRDTWFTERHITALEKTLLGCCLNLFGRMKMRC
ncbi:hypothetical protein CsSME_00013402 [Camellia sinensis var. sinensis]